MDGVPRMQGAPTNTTAIQAWSASSGREGGPACTPEGASPAAPRRLPGPVRRSPLVEPPAVPPEVPPGLALADVGRRARQILRRPAHHDVQRPARDPELLGRLYRRQPPPPAGADHPGSDARGERRGDQLR